MMLENSLQEWISSVCDKNFESFDEVLKEVSCGTLLSEIISKCGITVTGITKNPKTEKIKAANIEKTLDCLRKVSRMSQKYL